MAESINLSSATRTNLLALQNTTSLLASTQERLSTGLKVNSAIDDAIAFFQARSLSDRAGDLSVLKGSIDQGISSAESVAVTASRSLNEIRVADPWGHIWTHAGPCVRPRQRSHLVASSMSRLTVGLL